MSAIDPAILALALSDLQEELVCWGAVAAEAIHSAKDTQRKTNEAVVRMLHRACIVDDQAQRDNETSHDVLARQAELVHRCDDNLSTLKTVQNRATQLHDLAQTTVRHWLQELSAAQAWLARAEHRLELALRELAAAEAELSSAESHLRA